MSRATLPTVWITADQVSIFHTGLATYEPSACRVLIVESLARGTLQPYHKRKLALVYSGMRHFAADLRERGYDVDYYAECESFTVGFAQHHTRYKPSRIVMMEQAEWSALDYFRGIVEAEGCELEVTPTCSFIATRADVDTSFGTKTRLTMESFYRHMRRKTGLLMEGDAPLHGRWNFDAENRKPPKTGMRVPKPYACPPDATTREVLAMVERHFPDHPGSLDNFDLPVSRADALAALDDFIEHRLDEFGPYEDAMLAEEPVMFHSMLSSSINLGLLHPLECAERAEQAYRAGKARIESVEGFVRQLLGWREFIRGIYERFMPEYKTRNALEADIPVPKFYWTGETRMNCVKRAVDTTLALGYAHHIQRLMILANFGLIAGIEPLELNNWFWAMYIDAYDWVMVPNVIGMALHADGGIVGTKPYASSARYIDSMSNYCNGCSYSPKKATGEDACPFNSLYWDFLARHRERFAKNARMALIMRGLAGRPPEWLAERRAHAAMLRERLVRNEPI